MWTQKRAQIVKPLLNKENKAGGITILGFVTYYRAAVIRNAQYWH